MVSNGSNFIIFKATSVNSEILNVTIEELVVSPIGFTNVGRSSSNRVVISEIVPTSILDVTIQSNTISPDLNISVNINTDCPVVFFILRNGICAMSFSPFTGTVIFLSQLYNKIVRSSLVGDHNVVFFLAEPEINNSGPVVEFVPSGVESYGEGGTELGGGLKELIGS